MPPPPRKHQHSSSLSAIMSRKSGRRQQEYDEFTDPMPASSSGAAKFMTSVKRSISVSLQRKRPTEDNEPPAQPRYYYPDDAAATRPTVEEIAMGLHLSRTPHLRPVRRGRWVSSSPFSPHTPYHPRDSMSHYTFDPSQSLAFLYYPPSRQHQGSGRNNSSSASISSRPHTPQKTPDVKPQSDAGATPRPRSLPPPPLRSSMKKPPSRSTPDVTYIPKTKKEKSLFNSPIVSVGSLSTTDSVASSSLKTPSTLSSLSFKSASLKMKQSSSQGPGRSLLPVSLKKRVLSTRVGKLLHGSSVSIPESVDSAEASPRASTSSAGTGSGSQVRKAVRFESVRQEGDPGTSETIPESDHE